MPYLQRLRLLEHVDPLGPRHTWPMALLILFQKLTRHLQRIVFQEMYRHLTMDKAVLRNQQQPSLSTSLVSSLSTSSHGKIKVRMDQGNIRRVHIRYNPDLMNVMRNHNGLSVSLPHREIHPGMDVPCSYFNFQSGGPTNLKPF